MYMNINKDIMFIENVYVQKYNCVFTLCHFFGSASIDELFKVADLRNEICQPMYIYLTFFFLFKI